MGHSNCVQLLIDAGADKDAKQNVRRPRPGLSVPSGVWVTALLFCLLVVCFSLLPRVVYVCLIFNNTLLLYLCFADCFSLGRHYIST